jgi:hypothetical protein
MLVAIHFQLQRLLHTMTTQLQHNYIYNSPIATHGSHNYNITTPELQHIPIATHQLQHTGHTITTSPHLNCNTYQLQHTCPLLPNPPTTHVPQNHTHPADLPSPPCADTYFTNSPLRPNMQPKTVTSEDHGTGGPPVGEGGEGEGEGRWGEEVRAAAREGTTHESCDNPRSPCPRLASNGPLP